MIVNLQHEINRANEKITEALDKLEKKTGCKVYAVDFNHVFTRTDNGSSHHSKKRVDVKVMR